MQTATTRRTSDDPLRHALPSSVRRQGGRTTVEALCGAQVAIVTGPWEPGHERNCRRCEEAA